MAVTSSVVSIAPIGLYEVLCSSDPALASLGPFFLAMLLMSSSHMAFSVAELLLSSLPLFARLPARVWRQSRRRTSSQVKRYITTR